MYLLKLRLKSKCLYIIQVYALNSIAYYEKFVDEKYSALQIVESCDSIFSLIGFNANIAIDDVIRKCKIDV